MHIPKLLLKVLSQITQQVPLVTKLYASYIITVFVNILLSLALKEFSQK